jgi:hypothetical protein
MAYLEAVCVTDGSGPRPRREQQPRTVPCHG